MKNRFTINLIAITSMMFISEMIFRIISDLEIFDLSVIRIFFGCLIIASIISFLLSFMKYKISKYITLVFGIITAAYSWAQLGFMNFLGVYISLGNASQGGAVKDYMGDFFASFKPEYYIVYIPCILYIVYLIFFSKRFNEVKRYNLRDTFLIPTLVILLSCNVYYISLTSKMFEPKFATTTNIDQFINCSNQSQAINSFGTSAFFVLDFRAANFGKVVEAEEDFEYTNDKQEDRVIDENSRVINDTAWKELIANTKNEKYNKLNNYFINQPITDKNEYTDMFKGKNVIFILMESTNDIILEYPDMYPNMAKMANEGWNFTNNYSPRNGCATLNNEFSGMTSLYSIHSLCTAKKYRNNEYFEGVFGAYNSAGYVTFSAHDYTEAYYPRKTIHTSMGSGEYYGVGKLGISYSNEYVNWANDDDFMKAMLKIIDKKREDNDNKPFMTWLTTVSGHQPYSVNSIQGDRYFNQTPKNLPYDVRRFMSKLKIMDDGFGILLQGLEERGLLEDTVIVMYGDHYPYGISRDRLNKALSYKATEDMNAEQVPLVMYNPKMEPRVIESYTDYTNILPTVLNMTGINYDPRLYMGTDMNSPQFESRVVFSDGSWKNEYVYFNASNGRVKTYKEGYTEQDIARINNVIATKNKISELAISTNYFGYLGKNLTKIKDQLQAQIMCLDEDKESYMNGTHEGTKIDVEDVNVDVFDGSNTDQGGEE